MQKKQGNIKVFCRFRPFNQKQQQLKSDPLHRIANNQSQLIIKDMTKILQSQSQSNSQPQSPPQSAQQVSFMYDQVFDMDSTQQQVFEQVGHPVLKNILDGFNGTIMAYGQTSSGKTHTMQGYDMHDKQIKGIMPRIIEKLFVTIQKSTEAIQYKLKISIFELYMEKIRDLLDISKKDLKIRENKQGPYVQSLTEVYVGDKNQLFKLIQLGQKNRVTCTTNMNQHSSRSHMIFMLSLNQFNSVDSSSKTSKLFLIDLAGSEKVSKTGASGKVFQQAKKINLSLTNLGKVIKTLAEKGAHIPYRDSKLTRVLQDSLGGNSKTTLIVTCSPHVLHLPQTMSTLRFGQNAQKIKNKPKINRELTVQELQKIIQKLQKSLQIKTFKIQCLQDYITNTLKSQLPNMKEFNLQSFKKENNQQKQQTLSQHHHQLSNQESQQQLMKQAKLSDDFALQQQSSQQVTHQLCQEQQLQYQARIYALEQQISTYQVKMQNQFEKYHGLKREYTELHENLTSILTDNMFLVESKNSVEQVKNRLNQELQNRKLQTVKLEQKVESLMQKLEQASKINSDLKKQMQAQALAERNSDKKDKEQADVVSSAQKSQNSRKNISSAAQKQQQLQSNLIHDNVTLIKMIVGQLFQIIGPYQERQIIKIIQNDHWFKQIMQDGQPCIDFYQYERDKMKEQVQNFFKQKYKFQEQKRRSQENRNKESAVNSDAIKKLQRQQNQKVIMLQNKLDKLFDEYHQMITLQTSWKAECQLYERKLKRKQEKIQQLGQSLQQLQEQVQFLQDSQNQYNDYEDSRSVKSKIIKPLKGGFFFK